MKTRNGFVSNSSSSSFVIIGFENVEIDQEKYLRYVCGDEDVDKWIKEDCDLDDTYCDVKHGMIDSPIVCGDDGHNEYFGINACNSRDYGLDEYEVDLLEVLEKLEKFREAMGIDPSSRIKIYSGQNAC